MELKVDHARPNGCHTETWQPQRPKGHKEGTMRDVMRRYRQKGGDVTVSFAFRTLPDGQHTHLTKKVKAKAAKGLKKHLGSYGEVMQGCPCTECQAAGMALPQPKATTESELRAAAKAKLEDMHAKAKQAISDAKWAMDACVLRRRDGTYGDVKRKHNRKSLKLKTRAVRAVDAYKKAHANFVAAFGC